MSDNPYPAAFAAFASLLEERFAQGIYTTEDCIRYLFFSSLLTHAGITPNEIVLEYPHPSFAGKEVDIYALPAGGQEGLVAELEYDRNISASNNNARTRQAGMIFSDIGRLARFDPLDEKIRRFLIYITDGEMQGYFRNPHNGLEWFLDAEIGREMLLNPDRLNSLSATFRRNAGEIGAKTSIALVYSAEMLGHALRIYEINPGNRQP